MTQEYKELLLKDLCARLPYGVKMTDGVDTYRLTSPFLYKYIEMELKPYLRPMSSMTLDEFNKFTNIVEHICIGKLQINIANPEAFDYLNAHHFDYRGLIEKGLALEAQEGTYK